MFAIMCNRFFRRAFRRLALLNSMILAAAFCCDLSASERNLLPDGLSTACLRALLGPPESLTVPAIGGHHYHAGFYSPLYQDPYANHQGLLRGTRFDVRDVEGAEGS